MTDFQLLYQLPAKCRVRYDWHIYSDPLFLKSNNDFDQKHFSWVDKVSNEAHAHIVFSVVDKVAFSPHQLPFGGLEVSSALSAASIKGFLQLVESELRTIGVTELRIHQTPDAYTDQTRCTEAFEQLDFHIIQSRVFHTITVDEKSLFDRMHKMEQRKINMCMKNGAEFKELKKGQKLEAYKWIDRFRNLAYKPPSMNWVDLQNVSQRNPKVYKVFGVYIDGHLLAATVVVIVNAEVVYHFMPASHVDFQDYKKYSPMVFLVEGLYKWCQSQNVKVLDLGTSYVEMKMKDSLVKFKENIGGKPCSALSWQKTLSS